MNEEIRKFVLLTANDINTHHKSINFYLVHAGTYKRQSHKEHLSGLLIFIVHKTYEVYLSVFVIAYNCDCICKKKGPSCKMIWQNT